MSDWFTPPPITGRSTWGGASRLRSRPSGRREAPRPTPTTRFTCGPRGMNWTCPSTTREVASRVHARFFFLFSFFLTTGPSVSPRRPVRDLMSMARSGVVPGGGASPEAALHVLMQCGGDFVVRAAVVAVVAVVVVSYLRLPADGGDAAVASRERRRPRGSAAQTYTLTPSPAPFFAVATVLPPLTNMT